MPENREHTLDLRVKGIDASSIPDLIRISAEAGISQWTAQNFLDEIALSESILLRADSEGGEMIGFIVGRIVPGDTEGVRDAEIYNVAVVEAALGKGVGQVLMDNFRKAVVDAGVRSIWLEVRESNFRAIAFYERNGFEAMLTRPNFYNDPVENAICMKLTL